MPNFSLSPSVEVREVDLTTIIPAVATSIGAFAGAFTWGPVEEIKIITTEDELVNTFGKPNNNNYLSFFSAANFLSYSSNLRVVRVVNNTTSKNAVASGTAVLIKNESDYIANYQDGQGSVGTWAAKYPGTLGNSIKVSLCDGPNYYQQLTETATGTSGSNTVTMSASVATKIAVGDWLSFGTNATKYQVSAVSTNTVTLTSTLQETLSAATTYRYWEYYDSFQGAPGTSAYAAGKGAANDEIHVVVVDKTGLISGTPGLILERFSFVSKASDAKNDDGTSNYYKSVINNKSKYIWWMDHPTGGTDWGSTTLTVSGGTFDLLPLPETVTLTGGVEGTITSADEIRGYDLFKQGDTVDINLVITGASAQATVIDVISNLVEKRKDCVAFVSPELSDVLDNAGSEVADIKAWRNTLPSSSYVVADSGWKYQYDKYNDTFRWIPLNPDIAGLCARVDAEGYPWYSPAGYTKGQIKNVIKLAWNPGSKAIRDELYNIGVNSVVNFSGRGTVLFGDKTLLSKPSAFDRINVRRLFIVLEKAIATAAQYSLFELNDEFTRALFKAASDRYLSQIKGARGVYDYFVVCDETNNTPAVIDANGFVGDIYLKPTRSINFIQLNFVAVGTGVSFSEKILGRSSL